MITPASPVPLDREACYRAILARDVRFDGRFYTAVLSTGIYCRPICAARAPKIENCLFLPSAGAAHQRGFRPCLRCRPEVAPGLAGWRGTASTVTRALGLIADGGFDEGGADEFANRLGVGARHLRRLFDKHVGASPVSVAQAHRILFAKKLIAETSLTMTEIALASRLAFAACSISTRTSMPSTSGRDGDNPRAHFAGAREHPGVTHRVRPLGRNRCCQAREERQRIGDRTFYPVGLQVLVSAKQRAYAARTSMSLNASTSISPRSVSLSVGMTGRLRNASWRNGSGSVQPMLLLAS